jgi:hypothetical protein
MACTQMAGTEVRSQAETVLLKTGQLQSLEAIMTL